MANAGDLESLMSIVSDLKKRVEKLEKDTIVDLNKVVVTLVEKKGKSSKKRAKK